MLDMGFAEDLEILLDAVGSERQTVLFSATMPGRIDGLVRRHLSKPVRILVERAASDSGPAATVRQVAYLVDRAHKAAALGRVLDVEQPGAAIIFCRTRDEVDTLTETLNGRGYRSEALHGGMDQAQRDRVVSRLRSGTAELLVATDVAARGLDIDRLTHVVNYDVPSAPESYVHRVGRVGRAGREGVAITLAEPREHRMLKTIERVAGMKIGVEKLPTTADLRARRLELTRSSLEELLVDGALDEFRVVVESLSSDYDVVEIALAAVALAHRAAAGGEEPDEIPAPNPAPDADRKPAKRRATRAGGGTTDRVWVSAGREAGVRPQDLVGAVANETRLTGRDIGAIEITDRFSLIEVPTDAVREVVAALKATTLKGRKVQARRDRGPRT
jgi:ATP-dependent RNA helicase DeaD